MAISKYIGYFLMEYKRVKFHFGELILRVITITLRLALPYSVFAILVQTQKISQFEANSMLWAVLIGQIIYGSTMKLDLKIREDIRSGDISIRMSEPVNYIGMKLSQSFGHFLPMFFVLTVIFFPIMSLVFPCKTNIFILMLFMTTSFLINNLVNGIVGLMSFVVEENDGIRYIVSKLFFVMGNQVIPVALMPLWFVNIAKLTPFYLGLAAPAEAAAGRLDIVSGLLWSGVYVLLFWFIAQTMLSSLRKKIILNG
jgi:ABC-type uncharacterized transport system permease subunit